MLNKNNSKMLEWGIHKEYELRARSDVDEVSEAYLIHNGIRYIVYRINRKEGYGTVRTQSIYWSAVAYQNLSVDKHYITRDEAIVGIKEVINEDLISNGKLSFPMVRVNRIGDKAKAIFWPVLVIILTGILALQIVGNTEIPIIDINPDAIINWFKDIKPLVFFFNVFTIIMIIVAVYIDVSMSVDIGIPKRLRDKPWYGPTYVLFQAIILWLIMLALYNSVNNYVINGSLSGYVLGTPLWLKLTGFYTFLGYILNIIVTPITEEIVTTRRMRGLYRQKPKKSEKTAIILIHVFAWFIFIFFSMWFTAVMI